MTRQKTSATAISNTQRREEALSLRLMGLTYEQIAAKLGIKKPSAYALVKKAIETRSAENWERIEEMRQEEVERLRAMLGIAVSAAVKGDLGGVREVRAISDQLAKLQGLYAPVRQELTGKDGGAQETRIIIEYADANPHTA
jgi:transcriptional regulator with XRE-family HTH domain